MAEILGKPVYVRKPGEVRGGIGGIGKLARQNLKEIHEGRQSFHDAFNSTDGRFVIARKKGKAMMKTCLYK